MVISRNTGMQRGQEFVNRAAAGGVNLTWAEARAVTLLASDLYGAALGGDLFSAIWPLVGRSGESHGLNLASDTQYNIAWHGDWTHDASGSMGSGEAGSYGDTGLIPATVYEPDFHFAHAMVYINQAGTKVNGLDFHAEGSAIDAEYRFGVGCYKPMSAGDPPQVSAFSSGVSIVNRTLSGLGCLLMVRETQTSLKLYRNGELAQASTGVASTSKLATCTLTLGGLHTAGVVQQNSNARFGLVTVGKGLTATQAQALYSAAQRYAVALGRGAQ